MPAAFGFERQSCDAACLGTGLGGLLVSVARTPRSVVHALQAMDIAARPIRHQQRTGFIAICLARSW